MGPFRTEFSTLLLLTRDIEAGTESLKQGSVGDVFKMFRDQRESVY